MIALQAGRWILLSLIVSGVAAAGIFGLTRTSPPGPDTIEAAASLVPVDTHLFVALNTDLTSPAWGAVADLPLVAGGTGLLVSELAAVDVRLDPRALRLERFARQRQDDTLSMFGTVRALALSGRYTGNERGEVVAVFDSRKPAQLMAFLVEGVRAAAPGAQLVNSRDEALDLDLVSLRGGREDTLVVGRRGNVVYLSDDVAFITNLISALEKRGSLAASEAFSTARNPHPRRPLALLHASGQVFAQPEFARTIDQVFDSTGFDARNATLTASVTANGSGFAARATASSSAGWGELVRDLGPLADARRMAEATPRSAQLFAAGVGLRESLDFWLQRAEREGGPLATKVLVPLKQQARIDLRRDLLPLLEGSFAMSGAITGAGDPRGWFVVRSESSEPDLLVQRLRSAIPLVFSLCECRLPVTVERDGESVQLRWFEAPPREPALTSTARYQEARALLSADAANVLYLSADALPPDLRRDLDKSFGARLDRLHGAGLAWRFEEDIARLDLVLLMGTGG